jgi:two-component system, sensor histidine kinase
VSALAAAPTAVKSLRVLLLASGKDAAVKAELLACAAIPVEICASLRQLLQRFDDGVGLLWLADGQLLQRPACAALQTWLGDQPDWSQLPLIAFNETLRHLPGMLLLERDVSARTLLTCIEAGLRTRARQQERRDQLEQLRAMNVRLQASVQAKDEFLAVLAHELRTPLSAITAAVRILEANRNRPGEFTFARDVIARQSAQMGRLLEDLLDVTIVTSRPGSLQRRLQPLRPLIEAAVAAVQPALQARRHSLQVSQADTPALLNVDGARLSQVLINLLNNAIKYTPENGRIVLSAEATCDQFVVRVRDTGIGLAHDALESIFGMFAQVPQVSARAEGGLGIGLALARGITELHGGSLVAHSDGVGHGSEFVLTLPVAQWTTDEPQTASSTASSSPASTPVARDILLVDDNDDALQALRAVLELSGHRVACATSGEEALRCAATCMPQIALLDIGMPDMDGYELARRLQSAVHGRLVLIALTGWSQPTDRQQALAAGFDHHLAKPVDFEQLERLIREC